MRPDRSNEAPIGENLPVLLTIDEVAEWLRITPSTLRSQRRDNRAPGNFGIKVGKRLLWRLDDLTVWFEAVNTNRVGRPRTHGEFTYGSASQTPVHPKTWAVMRDDK